MIRVRRSTLEEFRRLVETEWGDEARLAAYIEAGQTDPSPNWQARAGTAWHAVLEDPESHYDFETDVYAVPDDSHPAGCYRFASADVNAAALLVLGQGDWEVEARIIYQTSAGPVEVSCTADHRAGLVVSDNKTKWGSAADIADYEDALQWRLYLEAHKCDVFRYLFWEFREPDEAGFCELRNFWSCRFWRYDRMSEDCRQWCDRFARWAKARGLLRHLTGKGVPVGR